jgi:hypothetical protein
MRWLTRLGHRSITQASGGATSTMATVTVQLVHSITTTAPMTCSDCWTMTFIASTAAWAT